MSKMSDLVHLFCHAKNTDFMTFEVMEGTLLFPYSLPPSANSKDHQMTTFPPGNSAIWHSLELAEGGSMEFSNF